VNRRHLSRRETGLRLAIRIASAFILLCGMLFLPAGTFSYWEAWLYLATLFIPMMFVLAYFLKNDPGLLERRMRMREKEAEQRRIVMLSFVYFLVTFTIPGFDRRFGWSNVPPFLAVVADTVVFLSYGAFFLVLKENRFASRTVEVEAGQEVVSSGPYAVVRHPMYLCVLVMYIASPLALGSYWGLMPSVFIIPILIARIRSEERVLVRELKGYKAYEKKTRFRLLPGIW